MTWRLVPGTGFRRALRSQPTDPHASATLRARDLHRLGRPRRPLPGPGSRRRAGPSAVSRRARAWTIDLLQTDLVAAADTLIATPVRPEDLNTHVIPGMDEMAAHTVAKLILAAPAIESDTDGTILGTIAEDEGPEMQSAPGIPGADVGSGGRI